MNTTRTASAALPLDTYFDHQSRTAVAKIKKLSNTEIQVIRRDTNEIIGTATADQFAQWTAFNLAGEPLKANGAQRDAVNRIIFYVVKGR